jgi:hypothetical protein
MRRFRAERVGMPDMRVAIGTNVEAQAKQGTDGPQVKAAIWDCQTTDFDRCACLRG